MDSDELIPGSLDTVHDLEVSERFVSLWPGFEPRPPVAANLAGAMNHLVSQALDHEFPAAPHFEAEIKSSNLKKVFEVVSEAARSTDDRFPVDKALRPLVRSIANPLKLGEMGLDATHFVLGQHWKNHFTRKAAETGGRRSRSVNSATGSTSPSPWGCPKEAENLVILIYAQQTNQFFHHSRCAGRGDARSYPPTAACCVRTKLPAQEQWGVALRASGFHLRRRGLAAPECEQRGIAGRGR